MQPRELHDDEVRTDVALVRRLLAAQFPHWADRSLRPFPSLGVDNTLYRLGDDMVVRLPRSAWSGARVDKELRWLPILAPHLTVTIPAPLGSGAPSEEYPWRWSIYRWITGVPLEGDHLADPHRFARELARFIAALRRIDPADGPPLDQTFATRDVQMRATITALRDTIDADEVTATWDTILGLPAWAGPPVWLHGDLAPGNVLLTDNRLGAVIDFAGMGVGDPAIDVRAAWTVLPTDARSTFRAAMPIDDATWARGRGWALAQTLAQLLYYRDTHPALVTNLRRVIRAILADHQHSM